MIVSLKCSQTKNRECLIVVERVFDFTARSFMKHSPGAPVSPGLILGGVVEEFSPKAKLVRNNNNC